MLVVPLWGKIQVSPTREIFCAQGNIRSPPCWRDLLWWGRFMAVAFSFLLVFLFCFLFFFFQFFVTKNVLVIFFIYINTRMKKLIVAQSITISNTFSDYQLPILLKSGQTTLKYYGTIPAITGQRLVFLTLQWPTTKYYGRIPAGYYQLSEF